MSKYLKHSVLKKKEDQGTLTCNVKGPLACLTFAFLYDYFFFFRAVDDESVHDNKKTYLLSEREFHEIIHY